MGLEARRIKGPTSEILSSAKLEQMVGLKELAICGNGCRGRHSQQVGFLHHTCSTVVGAQRPQPLSIVRVHGLHSEYLELVLSWVVGGRQLLELAGCGSLVNTYDRVFAVADTNSARDWAS
jgi:hypothetical protein